LRFCNIANVNWFTWVFFKMCSFDIYPFTFLETRLSRKPLHPKWKRVLSYLITLWKVWIKVILSKECRHKINAHIKRQCKFYSVLDCFFIYYRQCPGKPQTDRTNMCIWRVSKLSWAIANIFVSVASCTCISSPIVGLYIIYLLLSMYKQNSKDFLHQTTYRWVASRLGKPFLSSLKGSEIAGT